MAKQAQDEVVIPVEAVESFKSEAAEVTGQQPQKRTFTEEDVENIRKQEKDKLYKKIDDADNRVKILEEQLKTISQEREAAVKEAEKRAKAEAKAIKEKEFEELSAKELLLRQEDEFNKKINTVEAEWRARLEEIDRDRQAQAALLEKERRHQELQNYTNRRLQEEQEHIIPELLGLIGGSTEEEIETQINKYKEASSAILESVQKATADSQSRLKGAGVTAPPVGPMETQMEQQTLTAEDIRNMSMEQYQKMRERLLNARSSRGRF
jgi:DNA repair exonuclease SbcCD ATPase subunit